MLPRLLSVLLVIGVQVVFVVGGDFATPEVLSRDPDTILQPLSGRPADEDSDGAVDNPRLIRGLLGVRQDGCPIGYAVCNDGGCCPIGGACCGGRKCCATGRWCYGDGCCRINERGCGGNSCCTPGQTCCTGGGCCNPGWYCDVVRGVKGCCRNGRDCGNDGNGTCTTPGYVPCPGETFCCPGGYQCSRDSAGSPQCRGSGPTSTRNSSGGGFSSTPRPASTSTPRPTSTSVLPGGVNSAVTLRSSLNLFGIAPLLGWIAYVL